MKFEIKKCIMCNTEFCLSAFAPKRIYCSGKCKQKAYYYRHRKKRIQAGVLYAKENSERCNRIKRRSKRRIRAKQFTTDQRVELATTTH